MSLRFRWTRGSWFCSWTCTCICAGCLLLGALSVGCGPKPAADSSSTSKTEDPDVPTVELPDEPAAPAGNTANP